MSPEKFTLDDVVRESKEILDPRLMNVPLDFDRIESKLMARIETEAKAEAARVRFAGKRAWAGVAAALAMAAAIPFVMGRGTGAASLETASEESRADRSAGALAWKEGAGDVRIGAQQIAAVAGSALERGDAAETHGVRAVFERSAKGKTAVTWALEDASRITVKGTRGALVLALERGAIEAHVTPVPNGEAFAVDIDDARVAVHGTHLRVLREGTHVVVDLTEGVVSIGVPPRAGSTYGELVTAPAHIEFDATDPRGTLKVSHAQDRVRAALAMHAPQEQTVTVPPRAQIAPPSLEDAVAARPSPAPAPAAIRPQPVAEAKSVKQEAAVPAAPSAMADAHPEETIANAVRACARDSAGASPGDVVITVSSKLELRVNDSGSVESARFVPPLRPEVQACASTTIYKTHFSEPGTVTISLDFQR